MNHPYLDPAFLVSWSRLTPEAIKPDITEAISRAKENIRAICDQPLDSLTYESTFGALEKASEDLHLGWGRIMHLDSVNDEPAQREAIGEMLPEVVTFSSSVPLNPRLWTVLKAAASCDWVEDLSPVRQRFIQETLADFRESGADLPDDVKPEYAEIEAQLSLKTKKFAENVLDSTNAWELIVEDEAELSGLPDSVKEAAWTPWPTATARKKSPAGASPRNSPPSSLSCSLRTRTVCAAACGRAPVPSEKGGNTIMKPSSLKSWN